jgi:hypothetical protein
MVRNVGWTSCPSALGRVEALNACMTNLNEREAADGFGSRAWKDRATIECVTDGGAELKIGKGMSKIRQNVEHEGECSIANQPLAKPYS